MADIINLNAARKRRARAEAALRAAENRVRFGRTPAERAREAATLEQARTALDGAKREADPPAED